jgi:hypothetical protein
MRWVFDATADKSFYARLTSFVEAGSRNERYFPPICRARDRAKTIWTNDLHAMSGEIR